MTPHQTGALTGAPELRPGLREASRPGPLPSVRGDLLATESGSWLLLVPAGTCLVLMAAAWLGWG